jgi:hypothetical protein
MRVRTLPFQTPTLAPIPTLAPSPAPTSMPITSSAPYSREFGTTSLKIHWKGCTTKIESAQRKLKPPHRVELPPKPDESAFQFPVRSSSDKVFFQYNSESLRIFMGYTNLKVCACVCVCVCVRAWRVVRVHACMGIPNHRYREPLPSRRNAIRRRGLASSEKWRRQRNYC